MKRRTWIIALLVIVLLAVSIVVFYNTVFDNGLGEAYPDFAKDLIAPDGITMIDRVDRPMIQGSSLREGEIEIYDAVVVKTLVLEIEKAALVKSSKGERRSIRDEERMLTIGAIYKEDTPAGSRLNTVDVLLDGTFIVSKNMNGKEYYAKGKFSPYTRDSFLGLYTLSK